MALVTSDCVRRLDVVDLGRRRRFSLAFKWRVVEESLADGATAAGVCRRYGLSSSLMYDWRAKYMAGTLSQEALPAFMPLEVEATAPAMASSSTATSALVVVIGHRRIEVGAGFDTGVLASIVTTLEALP
jgi:transposase